MLMLDRQISARDDSVPPAAVRREPSRREDQKDADGGDHGGDEPTPTMSRPGDRDNDREPDKARQRRAA